MGTVVSYKQLSCTLLEKDIKDDVPIERYLSSESEIIGDDASINNHRNHQDYNSSYCLCLNMVPVRSTQKILKGNPASRVILVSFEQKNNFTRFTAKQGAL